MSGALAGTNVDFAGLGDADFSVISDDNTRREAVKKGTAYMSVWMYVIREFEDAIDDCERACITCNYDAAHAWDEGVAFYAGSLEGEVGISRLGDGFGKMAYALAEKRCKNFKTCGSLGDDVDGGSRVNRQLAGLFDIGQELLQRGECSSVRPIVQQIVTYMTIPLVQGTLRYAYKVGIQSDESTKSKAEGAVFAASVLPLVHDCDVSSAATIYDNMRLGSEAVSWTRVKEAFERNYDCLGITCADVGGLWDSSTNSYLDGAAPCTPPVDYAPIVGFLPASQVTDHNALDLDQQALEVELYNEPADFVNAARIYSEGGHSKSYSQFTVPPLSTGVPKGTAITGTAADGSVVYGKAYSSASAGDTVLKVQYPVSDDQATWVSCRVGGLTDTFTDGCLSATGALTVATEPEQSVSPSAVQHKAGRTLKGFSTGAQGKMYDGCYGCPYETYLKFYNYYGEFDYADKCASPSHVAHVMCIAAVAVPLSVELRCPSALHAMVCLCSFE